MIKLLDYILDLFRDEGQAQAFVANPDQALADAGLSTVSSAQLQSVAATASPSLAMGGSGEPVTDLQQAVSSYYGFQPQPDLAPQTDFSPSTDLASNNSFMSPTTNITDDHSLSFGMGDITLGDKTTAQGDGAVAVGGSTHGDIVSGDGAVLGDGNTVNNGDIHSAAGSTVTVGDGNVISEGNTSAGGDVLSSHDGTVIQTSGHGTTVPSATASTLTHTRRIDNSARATPIRRQFHAHGALVLYRGHLRTRQFSARQLDPRHVVARQLDPRDNAHRYRPGRPPRALIRAASEGGGS